jgi:hypothetical protein
MTVLAILAVTSPVVTPWLGYLQSGGVMGMFLVLTWGLLKRKIVMGWTYDRMEAERDLYRDLAFKSTDTAERQVATAEEMLRRMDRLALRGEVLEARDAKNRKQ